MRAVALVLLVLALPTASACTMMPSSYEDIEWTAAGIVTSVDWHIVRANVTVADAFPANSFHASPDGSRILFARASGRGYDSLCRFGGLWPTEWMVEGETPFWGHPLAVDWRGERAVTATGGRNVTLHELRSGTPLANITVGGGFEWDVRSSTEEGDRVQGALFSSNGSRLALWTRSAVYLYDAVDLRPLFPNRGPYTPGEPGVVRYAFSPDGDLLAVSRSHYGGSFSDTRFLDLTGDAHRTVAAHLDVRETRSLAWSPNGTFLAVLHQHPSIYDGSSSFAGALTLFDRDLVVLGEIRWQGQRVATGLAWSPDGKALALGLDRALHIVRLEELLPPSPVEEQDSLAGAEGRPFPGPDVVTKEPTPRLESPMPAVLLAVIAALALRRVRRA